MHDGPLAPAGSPRSVTVLVPGDLALRTGGYGYDREIIAGLRTLGWLVDVVSLDGSYPYPTDQARANARRVLAALPDGALVLADGLAFGAMALEAEREAKRLKLVALVHHPLADETGLDPGSAAAFVTSERRALAAARGVVVTSHATARALSAYGVRPERIAIVVPGTAPAPLARGTRGIDASEAAAPVELLCVATLVRRKGHDVLFAALASLQHLPWHLTCAGSDTLDPATARALREQLRASGIEARVTLAGDLDEPALGQAYDRADLFVLATRHEGYGMAVAEAVARGLPVVSTVTGGIPELVDDRSGAIVPMDDPAALAAALQPLLSDDGARARVAAGARVRRDTLPRWPACARAMADALVRFGTHGTVQR